MAADPYVGIELEKVVQTQQEVVEGGSRKKLNLSVRFMNDLGPSENASSNAPDLTMEASSLDFEFLNGNATKFLRSQRSCGKFVHGTQNELPDTVCDAIEFTKDKRAVIKWLRDRSQHVDDYRCTDFHSFSEPTGGLTALHLACLHNRPDVINILLQAEADVAVADDIGRTALHCLCASRSKESIFRAFKLIQPRLNCDLVNAKDGRYGRTPLMEACLMSRSKVILHMFDSKFPPNLLLTDQEGMTPLHHMCTSEGDIAELLLDVIIQKSNIEAKDVKGRTPFLVACEHNNLDVAKALLSAGANVYVQDHDQQTALHYLSASKSESIEELIDVISKRVTERARLSSYFVSAGSWDAAANSSTPTSLAIQFINKKDIHGRTPLQVALNNEHVESAKILISSGADIHIRLDDGRLPLQFACDCRKPHVSLAILLITLGADTGIKVGRLPKQSWPPLHFACREDLVDLVRCLLKHGADVKERDDHNKRPFYYVQSYEVQNLLSRAGGTDNKDRDPSLLDECCCKGYSDKAIYLIEHARQDLVKPKHLINALKFNYERIVIALIKHPNWYKFLRRTFTGDHNRPTTPFRELIKKMPDAAEMVLDKCIVSDPNFKDPGDINYCVIMNYEFLEDFAEPTVTYDDDDLSPRALFFRRHHEIRDMDVLENNGHNCSYEALEKVQQKNFTTKWGPTSFSSTNHPLHTMTKYDREKLLYHPVVSSLLHHKWNAFGFIGYSINFITYCLFLLFLNVYALTAPNPQSPECQNESINADDAIYEKCGANSLNFVVLCTSAIFITILGVGRLIFMTSHLFSFCDLSTVFDWISNFLLYGMSIAFVMSFAGHQCQCITPWQWELGVLALLLGWINLVWLAAEFPLTGIYVIMLIKMLVTFLKVSLLALVLVIAFGLSFFMAFHEPGLLRSPFSTPSQSLLKLVTMTTGEFEFDEIFRQSAKKDAEMLNKIPFPSVSKIIWVIFIVLMPILLTNMLVGLAVGDIYSVKQRAAMRKITLQIKLGLSIEEFVRRRPWKKILSIAWKKIYPNSKIPSIPAIELTKLRRRELWWKKHSDHLKFLAWGGGKYNCLKRISTSLKNADHDSKEGNMSALSAGCRSLEAEVEEVKLQLQITQTQNSELILEVKRSQAKLERVLDILSIHEKRSEDSGSSVSSPGMSHKARILGIKSPLTREHQVSEPVSSPATPVQAERLLASSSSKESLHGTRPLVPSEQKRILAGSAPDLSLNTS